MKKVLRGYENRTFYAAVTHKLIVQRVNPDVKDTKADEGKVFRN